MHGLHVCKQVSINVVSDALVISMHMPEKVMYIPKMYTLETTSSTQRRAPCVDEYCVRVTVEMVQRCHCFAIMH